MIETLQDPNLEKRAVERALEIAAPPRYDETLETFARRVAERAVRQFEIEVDLFWDERRQAENRQPKQDELARLREEYQQLSQAYLSLRTLIPGSFNTPHGPSHEEVWNVTENAAKRVVDTLREARIQIHHLQEKFGETGSGNAIVARIESVLDGR